MTEVGPELPGVDPTTASPARLYDSYLGGTRNLPVDRAIAACLKAAVPGLLNGVRANRAFHQRAAAWIAAQAGLRQFIDLGSGFRDRDIVGSQGNSRSLAGMCDHDQCRHAAPDVGRRAG